MSAASVFLILVALLPVAYWYHSKREQWLARLPPGPRSIPVFGNIFDLPKTEPWVTYRDWRSTYSSDLIFLDLPNQPTIVINSLTAAVELMGKRSRNYSDKPVMIMDVLVGWDWNLGLMPYGSRWRATRRTFHQFFNQLAVKNYRRVEEREIKAFLKRAVTFSKGIDMLSVSMTYAAIILDIMYGHRVQNMQDRYVLLSQKAVVGLSTARVAGRFWVEHFPILRFLPSWFPGSSARRLGDMYKPIASATRNELYEKIGQDVLLDTATPSIARTLIQKLREKGAGTNGVEFLDQVARDVTGIGYAAATDTQTATTSTFFLAMATSPLAQQKAQEELSLVIGSSRLPTIDDIPSLPYLQAVVLEVMRWSPVVPLGVPHRSIEDDEYDGYFIPSGTIIYPNIWAMLRDPEIYPDDPDSFNPDRFILNGKLNPDVPKPDALFGFGRRVCPGRHIALDTLSVMFASILHAYTIEKLDERDTAAEEFSTGLLSTPKKLPYRFSLRNAAALATIDAEDGQ